MLAIPSLDKVDADEPGPTTTVIERKDEAAPGAVEEVAYQRVEKIGRPVLQQSQRVAQKLNPGGAAAAAK